MINKNSDRIGQVRKNTYGSLMEVVEYNSCMEIVVKFLEHGNQITTRWSEFTLGKVKNVYDKSVCCIGFLGEGNYNVTNNGKETNQYSTWYGMIKRCYNPKALIKNPTYINCTVSKEWHNFQNFAAWYDQNYYEVGDELMCLDKDILVKGNKIYSSDTCIFVPSKINSLFTKSDVKRGQFPIGVSLHPKNKTYIATCKNNKGKKENLGSYDNPLDAFQSYKTYKEKLIKQVAEYYIGKIPTKLYNAMVNYKVEIND